MASPAGKGITSNDDRLECRTSFVLEDQVPTFVDDDVRVVDPPREMGVLGGEFKVNTCEPNDLLVCWVLGLLAIDMDGTLMPKSKSSRLARCVLRTFLVHSPTRAYRIR